jgi:hypothetical protein
MATIGYIGPEDNFKKWSNQYKNDRKNEFIGRRWKDHYSQSIEFLSSFITYHDTSEVYDSSDIHNHYTFYNVYKVRYCSYAE